MNKKGIWTAPLAMAFIVIFIIILIATFVPGKKGILFKDINNGFGLTAKIIAKNGIGAGEPYKLIDWNLTADKFIQKLKETEFFDEFKYIFKHKID